MPVALVLPSGEEVSIWEEFQDELARYHFLQANEASPVDPDWFTIEELELEVESLPPNMAHGHDGISLDIVRKVFQYHPQWLLDLYND